MPFSAEDKDFLITTIGDIVAGATTGMARDISLIRADVAELKGDVRELKLDVAELKGGFAGVERDVGELQQDVRDIRHHVALLSRDAMLTKERDAKDQRSTEDRLAALEKAKTEE